MVDLVWLIPAFPLAGFLILLIAGRKLGEPGAGWLATAACGGAFVSGVAVFIDLWGKDAGDRVHQVVLFDWLPMGGLHVDMGLLLDPLSITMVLFITGIGTLIHLYSIGYMHGDEKFSKFFLYLNLFVFSMLMLVLGNNLLVTFLGWEGVGACSYFLISFWFTEEANASAGKKAFVTNRVGDWGFMMAMFIAFQSVGTITYFANEGQAGLLDQAGIAPITATAIAAFLFFGAMGKSAQLPLYIWLPDAMAGPTPVSALIHAATMVTSGIYLLSRVNPLLHDSYSWLPTTIAWVGVLTALFAATIAVAQSDIKKVLAYSTVSQLGYMFLAIGVGAYIPALFHMITHAFFKALLFLGSGSVIHGMHHEQDMRKMGGLRKLMPITAATFIIGWLAIAGIPPFAGFWSKDEILLYASQNSWALYAVGFVTAVLTAFYMSRQVFMVFFGEGRYDTEGEHAVEPHESPWTMTLPLVVLAGLSIVGGALLLPFSQDVKFLEKWLYPVFGSSEVHISVPGAQILIMALITIAACVAAMLFARRVYLQHKISADKFEPEILARGWRYDETITALAGGPGRALFQATADFDHKVVDGAVNGVAKLVESGAQQARKTQNGNVRTYALGITIGAVILVGFFLGQGL